MAVLTVSEGFIYLSARLLIVSFPLQYNAPESWDLFALISGESPGPRMVPGTQDSSSKSRRQGHGPL